MFGKTLQIALRFTLVTTLILGIGYPLLVTGFAQLALKRQANGELITRDGDGHTGFQQGNNCVDNAVNRYLVGGKVPQDNLSC